MDDLISRRAALDAMCSACGYDCDKSEFVYNAPQDEQIILCPEHYALASLPSAQPEPKKGKWVYGEDSTADCVDGYRCSQCGFFVPWDYNHKFIDYINDYAYCPKCGAKMKGATT